MKVFNNFWPLDIWKGSENVTEGPPSTKSVDIEQCSRIIPCKINTFRKKIHRMPGTGVLPKLPLY